MPSLEGGVRTVDRLLRRLTFLPRTAQIGVRSVTRRTRRTIATVVQIALAVGTLVGVLALMNSVTSTTEEAWNQLHYDLDLNTVVGKQLDAQADRLIRTTPGVEIAQPVLTNAVEAEGKDAFLWGLSPRPMFDQKVEEGRWFTSTEEGAGAPVTVIAKNIARAIGADVGDTVAIRTAAGPAELRVVGMTGTQMQNGLLLLTPLSTLRTVLDSPDTVNGYWVRARASTDSSIGPRLRSRIGSRPRATRSGRTSGTSTRPATSTPTVRSAWRSGSSAS